MKIFDVIKRIVCVVSCSGIILSAPAWAADNAIYADEPAYNIILTAETVQYDISKHSGDKTAEIKLSIENNPGFSEMYIIVEKSPQISFYYPSEPAASSGKYSGIKNEIFEENRDVVFLTVPSYSTNKENSTFASIKVKLPDDINPDDFYEIKFLDSFSVPERNITKEVGILKDKVLTGKTSFSQMSGGGIKIVESQVIEAPKTEVPSETRPEETNAPAQNEQQPSEPENNGQQISEQGNNEQNSAAQQNDVQQTEAPQTEALQPEVSSTETSTVSETLAVLQNSVVSSNVAAEKTTPVVSDSDITASDDTDASDDVESSADPYDAIQLKPDRTIEIILIVAIVVVSILGIVTFIGLFKYYRKKDSK